MCEYEAGARKTAVKVTALYLPTLCGVNPLTLTDAIWVQL